MVALLSFAMVSVTILEISVRVSTDFRWCEGVGSHLIHALLWWLDALGFPKVTSWGARCIPGCLPVGRVSAP